MQAKVPSQEQRIELWKLTHARSAFLTVKEGCRMLIDSPKGNGWWERKILTVGIVGTYCRPFKDREETRLGSECVPNEMRQTHEQTLALRDKLFMHRGLNSPRAEWGHAVPCTMHFREDWTLEVNAVDAVLTDEKCAELLAFADALIAKVEREQTTLLGLVGPFYLKPGRYLVSLEESPQEWLLENPFSDSIPLNAGKLPMREV